MDSGLYQTMQPGFQSRERWQGHCLPTDQVREEYNESRIFLECLYLFLDKTHLEI